MPANNEPNYRRNQGDPVFLLCGVCPPLANENNPGTLLWHNIVHYLSSLTSEQLIAAIVTRGGLTSSFDYHSFNREEIKSLASSLVDGDLLILPAHMPGDVYASAAESLSPGVTMLLLRDTADDKIGITATKLPAGARLAVHPTMDPDKIKLAVIRLKSANTGAKLFFPSQTPKKIILAVHQVLQGNCLQWLDKHTSPDIFVQFLLLRETWHVIPADMAQRMIAKIVFAIPVGSIVSLASTNETSTVATFARGMKSGILQLEGNTSINVAEIVARNMHKNMALLIEQAPVTTLKVVATALREDCGLIINDNVDIEERGNIASCLRKNALLMLRGQPSIPVIEATAAGLHDGAIMALVQAESTINTRAAILALGNKAVILIKTLTEEAIISAVDALNENRNAILTFNPNISTQIIGLAASRLRDGATILLHVKMPLTVMKHAVSCMSNGARVLLPANILSATAGALAANIGSGATMILDPEASEVTFLLVAKNLNAFGGLLLDANTPLNIAKLVSQNLSPQTNLLLPQKASTELIKIVVSNAKPGVSIILHPNMNEDNIKLAAQFLSTGVKLLLLPNLSIPTLIDIAKSTPPGAILYFHPDMPEEHKNIIAASLNKGAMTYDPNINSLNLLITASEIIAEQDMTPAQMMEPVQETEVEPEAEPQVTDSELNETQEMPSVETPVATHGELIEDQEIPPVETIDSPQKIEEDCRIQISDRAAMDEWAHEHDVEYLHSATGHHRFEAIEDNLFIHKVSLLGNEGKIFGVFAQYTIKKNTLLGEYKGELGRFKQNSNLDYVYRLSHNRIIDAAKKRNWTAMVNSASFASTANVEAIEENGHIYYKSIKVIHPDEQLLIYYGDEYQFDKQYRRFIRTTDAWLETSDILTKYAAYYEPESTLLPHGFTHIFGIPSDTRFMIPIITSKMEHPDLPFLAINANNQQPEPQCRQENITSLIYYCWHGNVEEIKNLLQQKANPDIQTSISGITPLQMVISTQVNPEKKKKLIDLLLQYNATLEIQDRDNQSILHRAVKTHSVRLVKYLIEEVDKERNLFNLIDDNNDDPFVFALKSGTPEIVNCLKTKVTAEELRGYLKTTAFSETVRTFVTKYMDKAKDAVLLDILDYLIESLTKKRKTEERQDVSDHLWTKIKITEAMDALADIQKQYSSGHKGIGFFNQQSEQDTTSSSNEQSDQKAGPT